MKYLPLFLLSVACTINVPAPANTPAPTAAPAVTPPVAPVAAPAPPVAAPAAPATCQGDKWHCDGQKIMHCEAGVWQLKETCDAKHVCNDAGEPAVCYDKEE